MQDERDNNSLYGDEDYNDLHLNLEGGGGNNSPYADVDYNALHIDLDGERENEGTNQEPSRNPQINVDDVEPVKLGKKTVALILLVLLFLLVIIMFSIKGRIQLKKTAQVSTQSNNTLVSATTEGNLSSSEGLANSEIENTSVVSENQAEVVTENSENVVVSSEADSSLVENSKSENLDSTEVQSSSFESDTSNQGSKVLVEAGDAVLSDAIETSGLVSGKSTYLVDNSYLYRVGILVVVGNDKNILCSYYCPKNTWDALNMGDSLVVTYQTDSTGNISINTISK